MKKYLLGFFALAIAIAFSAFTFKSTDVKCFGVASIAPGGSGQPATYQLIDLDLVSAYWCENPAPACIVCFDPADAQSFEQNGYNITVVISPDKVEIEEDQQFHFLP